MKRGLAGRFGEIDDALKGFVAEMEAQGVWDNVVLAAESEFARASGSAGGGSDHARAGKQFIIIEVPYYVPCYAGPWPSPYAEGPSAVGAGAALYTLDFEKTSCFRTWR